MVEPLSYSPVVDEEGGVQAIEFEARAEMASYTDVPIPWSSDGPIGVAGGGD